MATTAMTTDDTATSAKRRNGWSPRIARSVFCHDVELGVQVVGGEDGQQRADRVDVRDLVPAEVDQHELGEHAQIMMLAHKRVKMPVMSMKPLMISARPKDTTQRLAAQRGVGAHREQLDHRVVP